MQPHPASRVHRSAADLRYPWPSVPSARARARYLESQARAWALEQQLLDPDAVPRFDAVGVGLLTALTYPGAERERQVLLAQFFGWIFLQDDTFDEPDMSPDARRLRRHLSACDRVLRSGRLPQRACPRLAALKNIRDRLAASADPACFARFCSSMRAFWQDGVLAEHRLRQEGRGPDARAYLRARLHSVCLLPPLDLATWASGISTPAAAATSPALQGLRALAAIVAALANDVFSFRKEQRQGDPNNKVLIWMRQEGISEEDALDRVVDEHDALVARFERRSLALMETAAGEPPLLAFHIEACRRWMVGAVDWQHRSTRYAAPCALRGDANLAPEVMQHWHRDAEMAQNLTA